MVKTRIPEFHLEFQMCLHRRIFT